MANDNTVIHDLSKLIRKTTLLYKANDSFEDVELTESFKVAFSEALSDSKQKSSIEFYKSTALILSPTNKMIYVPNQWFAIAAYGVDVYSEICLYKKLIDKIVVMLGEKRDIYIKCMRDLVSTSDKNRFSYAAETVLKSEYPHLRDYTQSINYLWRFVSDYSWWSGQKTIDRTDFFVSVILNMLNLVNASQGYVAEIVALYAESTNLKNMVRYLDSFTINYEGTTCPILDDSDTQEGGQRLDTHSQYSDEEQSHTIPTIKISADSLRRMGEDS